MARVGILFKKQAANERPWYHISRTKANELVTSGTYMWASKKKNIIWELVESTAPDSDPSRHFAPKPSFTISKYVEIPTTQDSLNLYYPVKDNTQLARPFGYYQNWESFSTVLPKYENVVYERIKQK